MLLGGGAGGIEWKRDVQPLLPWFVLGASAGLFTAWVESTLIGAKGVEFALTPVQRLLLAGRAIWFYAGKVVWPANLTFFYPRWNVDASVWWQFLFPVGAIAAAVALWRVAHRNRGPLAGFLIFAGTLFPVLGFFNIYPFRYAYVADHFAYLASLGILVPLASALSARPLLAVLLAGTFGRGDMASVRDLQGRGDTLSRQRSSAIRARGWRTITWQIFCSPTRAAIPKQ